MATLTNRSTTRLSPDDPRIARPIFTLREAAGHLAVPVSTLHVWAADGGRPLVTTRKGKRLEASVPFIGFAEAFVLAAFRKAGVPMQRIRPAVEVLRRDLGIEHALASQELYTDGAEVLYRYAERDADGLELTVLRTGQKQFSDLVLDYLSRITYGNDGWARQVELPAYGRTTVIVDPERAFGLPFVVDGGTRVEDLGDRFVAGDTLKTISQDFGVPEAEVEDVIRVAAQASASAS